MYWKQLDPMGLGKGLTEVREAPTHRFANGSGSIQSEPIDFVAGAFCDGVDAEFSATFLDPTKTCLSLNTLITGY